MPEPRLTSGRCVLRAASKPHVRRGQLLMSAEPFIYLLKAACWRIRCSYCLQSSSELQRCSGCRTFYFCNRDCQKKAWAEFHRSECRRLKAVAPRQLPDTALLLARLIVKLRHGGDQISERITDTRQRSFKDLMSHYKDIKSSQSRMEHVTSLAVVLRSLLGNEGFPNMCELIGMYGRICVNCFNILDGEMSPIAVGVYLAPSIIDHSCQPNAAATFSGRTIAVRALEEIPAFSWDKVRISYVDTLADRETRRRDLQAGYFFQCDCSRCMDDSEFVDLEWAVRCGTAGCPAPVIARPPSSVTEDQEEDRVSATDDQQDQDPEQGRVARCSRCRYSSFSGDLVQQVQQICQTSRSIAQESTVYYDTCSRCLERQEPLLHPNNVHRVKLLDLALEAAINTDMWERALELGHELEPGYRLYYGPYHPLLGVLYLKLGKIALYRFRHELADRYLRGAAQALSVSHGSGHTLVRHTLAPLMEQATSEMAPRP